MQDDNPSSIDDMVQKYEVLSSQEQAEFMRMAFAPQIASADPSLQKLLEAIISAIVTRQGTWGDFVENLPDDTKGKIGELADETLQERIEVLTRNLQRDSKFPIFCYKHNHMVDEAIPVAMREATEQNTNVYVVFWDIDYFKFINDVIGYDTGGDSVLKYLHLLWGINLRDEDMLGRYGGDEHYVLLIGSDNPEDTLVKRMQAKIASDTTLQEVIWKKEGREERAGDTKNNHEDQYLRYKIGELTFEKDKDGLYLPPKDPENRITKFPFDRKTGEFTDPKIITVKTEDGFDILRYGLSVTYALHTGIR